MKTNYRPYILFLLLLGSSMRHLYAQPQQIHVSGAITDEENCPVPQIKVVGSFNGDYLGSALSDSSGFYEIHTVVYGGIQTINLTAYFGKFDVKKMENIPLDTLNVNMKLWGKNGKYYNIDHFTTRCGMSTEFYQPHYPWFGTYRVMNYGDVYYHKRISYAITITNKNSQPITNANVEITVRDDKNKPRSGSTDEKGNLMLHMEFEDGALNGKIYISAKGYKPKKMRFQKFSEKNSSIFTLKKLKP